jgi:hypothetical protein
MITNIVQFYYIIEILTVRTINKYNIGHINLIEISTSLEAIINFLKERKRRIP